MAIYKKKELFERIILIGPMSDSKKWVKWCYAEGYWIKFSGPKPIGSYRYDMGKFKIVAEKKIKEAK